MKKIAIHQPNFIPWFPYFYKMAMVDVFILHTYVLFSKSGYQNRFFYKDKWITKPVHQKTEAIHLKDYVGHETERNDGYWIQRGGSLHRINYKWIDAIKDTLNIGASLEYEWPKLAEESLPRVWEKDPTNHLINIIKQQKGDVYVTNEEAKHKYLDEDKMRSQGIEIEYCKVPKNLNKSVFEMFEEYGIEGTINQLPKKTELCTV